MTPKGQGARGWRLLRGLAIALGAIALFLFGAGIWVRSHLRDSLPQLDGTLRVAGVSTPIVVERDSRGVPTIRGRTRLDVARGVGFVHGQDRFFQMDLLRRRAAGELAQIVGASALGLDREIRVHRFRNVARRVLANASPPEIALVRAYAEGVNAGLGSLKARPFEYMLLRVPPAPWLEEDTVLCTLAMFITLQDSKGENESALGVMRDVLPPALYDFLTPQGTEWDAPMVGAAVAQPPIPGPEVLDLRGTAPYRKAADASTLDREPPQAVPGSNNWAVAGTHTEHGGAIVANDMHLPIDSPNIWYRVAMLFPEGSEERRLVGVTLPGTPALVVGSNGYVAWGFTNSYGDWTDLVELEPVPGDDDAYATPGGPLKFTHTTEVLHVKGAAEERLDVLGTIWGPVIDKDHRGRRRALAWVAHDPDGVNLGLFGLESARNLDAAQAAAARAGIPAQNFVCADRSGRVGWTIMGRIPRRVGIGRLPTSWADGTRRWEGWLAPEEYPRIVDPGDGRIWSANARIVDGAMLEAVGDGGYDLGARQKQIRDDLFTIDKANEKDMLLVQLDDRALFLQRWHDLALRALTPEVVAGNPNRAEFRRLVEDWKGRASVDSVGYRLVRAFRDRMRDEVLGAVAQPCLAVQPPVVRCRTSQSEGPLWALVSQRPPHLLNPAYSTWDDQFVGAIDHVITMLLKNGGTLAQRTWGERNSPRIGHPLSAAVPFLARFLDMPRQGIDGDSHMPRVQDFDEGASERLSVSPGKEKMGLFQMPSGQSGHPLSPHYSDGHDDWVHGRSVAFLPGPPIHTLLLVQ